MFRSRGIALALGCAAMVCALCVAGCGNNPNPQSAGTSETTQSPTTSPSMPVDTTATTLETTTSETINTMEADVAPLTTVSSSDTTTAVSASGAITPEQILSLVSPQAGAGGSADQVSVVDYTTFGDWAAAIIYVGDGDQMVTFHNAKGEWTVKTRDGATQGVDEEALKAAGVPQQVIDWFSGGANWGD
jgi:hypothetical protein